MFLNALPSSGSAYREALRNSPETVEALLGLEDEDELPHWSPSGVEWTLQDELLATVVDVVTTLLSVEAARGTGRKPRSVRPFPRPVRAVDLARSQAEAEYLAELDDEVAEAQARWRAAQEPESPAV